MKKSFFYLISIILIVASVSFICVSASSLNGYFLSIRTLSERMEEFIHENEQLYNSAKESYNYILKSIIITIIICIGMLLYTFFAIFNMRRIVQLTNTDHAIRYTYEEYKAKMDAKKAEIKEKKLQSKKERLRKELEEMEKAE